MDDIEGFTQDMQRLADAVSSMQKRLKNFSHLPRLATVDRTTSNLFLMRRQQVLERLGIDRKVGRASWSHDRGDAIIFDAWDDNWENDSNGNPYCRYPMRTKKYYALAEAKANPSRGHTRWQYHVDLVLAGQRSAIAIMPVRSAADRPNSRTRGWLPQYATGQIKSDRDEYWFYPDSVSPI